MSSLRVTNIESHSDTSSPTVDEKVKIKNSSGDVLLEVDGKNMSGVGTVFVGPGIVTCTNFRATEKFMVDTAYISAGSVGIGSTTTDGRDAGIGTMVGSMIYNTTTGRVQIYKPSQGWQDIDNRSDTAPSGITATGGTISEYTDNTTIYRAHIFTSTGTFNVTAIGDYGSNVDSLVVAGGGGGGGDLGGGGGAGGFRTASQTVGISPYPVTVGGGGGGGQYGLTRNDPGQVGSDGGYSSFGTVTSTGGGGGGIYGSNTSALKDGRPGGSGGGAGGVGSGYVGSGGNSTINGNPGGTAGNAPDYGGGGGGGAGAAGGNGTPTTAGVGGDGLANTYAYGPGNPVTYAGGGGGSDYSNGVPTTRSPGGAGGGGAGGTGQSASIDFGPSGATGLSGTVNTGGGGGGGSYTPGNSGNQGGHGASGIVVVRYQIAETGTAKATGGAISFAAGKTIHQFYSTGTFAITDATLSNVDCLVIGGGGGGGTGSPGAYGGGGGAGALHYVTNHPVSNASPYPVTVGAGGFGVYIQNGTGTNGTASIFDSITAAGGGAGRGAPATTAGIAGGSGGGAAYTAGAGGTGSGDTGGTANSVTPANGWGNDGAAYASGGMGGGGGGAGGIGGVTLSTNGDGGLGLSYNISGSAVTYATGGAGSFSTPGGLGEVHTGNGGNGGRYMLGHTEAASGGGSGIVVISYPT